MVKSKKQRDEEALKKVELELEKLEDLEGGGSYLSENSKQRII